MGMTGDWSLKMRHHPRRQDRFALKVLKAVLAKILLL
jgi:hypothetical protein